MGRSPTYSHELGLKKGPWTPEEDEILMNYIKKHGGHGSWRALPKQAGLNRCGKSCRLRWTNYLRPDIKRGNFSDDEEHLIINLHSALGNKWSQIAAHLPGRTDNEIKNFWNTHVRKKLVTNGIDPKTHEPLISHDDLNYFLASYSQLFSTTNLTNSFMNINNPLDSALSTLKSMYLPQPSPNILLLQNLLQIINSTNSVQLPNAENRLLQSLYHSQYNGLVNGTNAGNYYQDLPAFGNMHVNPADQSLSECLGTSNTVGANVGGLRPETFTDNTNRNSYSSCYDQKETRLPGLVSAASSAQTFGTDNQKTNQTSSTTPNFGGIGAVPLSPVSSMFETWEKLLDDEDSGSNCFWKDLTNDLLAIYI